MTSSDERVQSIVFRPASQRSRVRDPYADLLRDTRGLRRDQAAAREAWYAALPWDRKEDILFELEMLMKGLVCFANPRNHPGAPRRTPVVAMNFREELAVARQCVARIVALCRQLLGPRDRAYLFQRYLETLLPEDRNQLHHDDTVQESPEDSLLQLRHGLTMLGEVIDGLLRLDRVPYRLFHSSLVMAQREIQRSQFFNPLVALEFRPEFDRIHSQHVLETIQTVGNDTAHRIVALAYLSCFRMLRYVKLIRTTCADPSAVRRCYVLLAVVRSDARAIVGYLRDRAPEVLAEGFERELLRIPAREIHSRFDGLAEDIGKLVEVRSTLEGIAAALRAEIRGMFEGRIPSPGSGTSVHELARAVMASTRGLQETLETSITRLTATLRGGTDPALLFEDPDSRRTVSERLRRDLWMFAQVLRAFVAKARAAPESPDRWTEHGSLQFVREFWGYFRAMGRQFMHSLEYPRFERFLTVLEGLYESDVLEASRLHDAVTECEAFQKFLLDMFDQISQREELRGAPFDKRAAAETLKLYLESK